MGNIDSRAKFDSGYLLVQTDKPFYEPGEMITGKINIRSLRPIDASHLELEIKGKERGSFFTREYKTIEEPDGTRRMESYMQKRHATKEIISCKMPFYKFP
jgi:hypothetical protein